MDTSSVIFSNHATERMFERHITKSEVFEALASAEVIEIYTSSILCLGWSQGRPIHLVVTPNLNAQQKKIVTAYEPDPLQWMPDWKRRKP